MRSKAQLLVGLLLGVQLLLGSGTASAHHSAAMFDHKKEVSIEGVVKDFLFQNPHTSITLIAMDASGHLTNWYFEAASVRGLALAGWRRSTLKPGDKVTLVGYPLRDGRPGAMLERAIFPDGKVLKTNLGANY